MRTHKFTIAEVERRAHAGDPKILGLLEDAEVLAAVAAECFEDAGARRDYGELSYLQADLSATLKLAQAAARREESRARRRGVAHRP